MNLQAIDKFHKTRLGYFVFGLVEVILAYVFISWALNDGNLWDYLLAFVFLFGFLQNLVRMVLVHKK